MPEFVRRRSGELVPFDPKRIERAIWAAAQAIGGRDRDESARMAEIVVRYIEDNFQNQNPNIEKIQDIVEAALMQSGHTNTARAFILYRERRRIEREQEQLAILERIKSSQITMQLPDGSTQPLDFEAIVRSVRLAADGLKQVDVEAVVQDAGKNLYNGVKLKEVERALINAARTRIELHPEYSLLAARLLWQVAYGQVFGIATHDTSDSVAMHELYAAKFGDFLKYGTEKDLLDPRLLDFDIAKIAAALRPERDLLFHYLGAQTIYDRYLLKTVERPQRIAELPQWMWMRVAMGLAINEVEKEKRAIEFYDVLSNMYFVSSTPTLFNSGTTHSQMSSCYLNTVPDDLTSIFKTFADNAQLSKWAGGIGTDWTPVRATNSFIKGTNGESQGVIPFLKIFNDVALAVNQGGKRKGAMCAYLEIWHGDVEEFLEAKKNTGDERRRLHDVNTALWIPDLFMKRMLAGEDWTLFSPNEVPELHDLYGAAFEKKYIEYEAAGLHSARKMKAADLWRKALTMLYETGHPWITFKDPCNIRSPQDHVGVVHNSNLCTEITLNTSKDETAVCNLGSLNLDKMLLEGALNEPLIAATTRTAMRMLDNVVDANFYPTIEAKNSNMRHRPVGLGLMGYADALYQLGLSFDSEAALAFADQSMEMISYYSILASSELARERGAYESYKGSKWDRGLLPIDTLDLLEQERGVPVEVDRVSHMDWAPVREHIRQHGMRNSNCMAIAPTATISNITGTVPCTEPIFKNIYMKENLSGSFVIINRHLVRDLENLGLWSPEMATKIKYFNGSVQQIAEIPDNLKRIYREVFEVEAEWVLKAAALRAKWIDQSASTNVFIVTTSGKRINEVYQFAWRVGLKTTYYCRTQAVSQVEKTIELPIEIKKPEPAKAATPAAEILPEPLPKIEAAPVAAGLAAFRPAANPAPVTAGGVKLCKLEDPNCEACQ